MNSNAIAKLLIISGLVLTAVGALLYLSPKSIPFGRLPGDINVVRENFKFSFPVTTCIVLSIALSILWKLMTYFLVWLGLNSKE